MGPIHLGCFFPPACLQQRILGGGQIEMSILGLDIYPQSTFLLTRSCVAEFWKAGFEDWKARALFQRFLKYL